MLIVCPNCATGYDVSPATLGDVGRMVRCAQCHKKWLASASSPPVVPDAPADAVAAAAPAVAAVAKAAAAPPAPAAPPDPGPAPDGRPADGGDDKAVVDEDADALWGVPEFSSPPLAPATGAPMTVEAVAEPPAQDIESLAARRAGGTWRKPQRRSGRLAIPTVPAIIAVELAAIVAIAAWRAEIVHVLPQTASLFSAVGLPVNLRGLAFDDVRTSTDTRDGVTVLIVEGGIGNTTRSVVAVPRLRFALRNAARVELISWTAPPGKAALGPGETLAFRSRLAAPPADGHDVVVRFLTRQDLMIGTR
jgi:predicted Zn finger-like uncharacterized protein